MNRELKRKRLYIEPNFQAKFIFRFCLIAFISSLLIGGLVLYMSHNSTTVTIKNTKIAVQSTSDFILPILALTIVLVTTATAAAVTVLTLYVSHKIVGPVHRLQREVDLMQDGDLVRNFNIREKDQLQALAHSLSLTTNKLRAQHLELKNACQSLFFFLEQKEYVLSPANRDDITPLLDKIQLALDFFKV